MLARLAPTHSSRMSDKVERLVRDIFLPCFLAGIVITGGPSSLSRATTIPSHCMSPVPPETAAEKAELSLIRRKIRHLAQRPPLCFAYVTTGRQDQNVDRDICIAPRFRYFMGLALKRLKRNGYRTKKVRILYAYHRKPTSAKRHLAKIQRYIRGKLPNATEQNVKVRKLKDFVKQATCRSSRRKETILIHNNAAGFYYWSLPTATIWGGTISRYDVIFLAIR